MPSPSAVPHETALHGAAERGLTPFVKFLVENGAGLNREGCERQNSARSRERYRRSRCPPGCGEPYPETVKLIESLMAAKGISTLSP
jgi:hypothetical protein